MYIVDCAGRVFWATRKLSTTPTSSRWHSSTCLARTTYLISTWYCGVFSPSPQRLRLFHPDIAVTFTDTLIVSFYSVLTKFIRNHFLLRTYTLPKSQVNWRFQKVPYLTPNPIRMNADFLFFKIYFNTAATPEHLTIMDEAFFSVL